MAVEVREIKSKIDILDIIRIDVDLTKKGTNYWGLCPFHAEKTASFKVNPDKQLFYCFGCQASGDVITYIKLRDNVDFKGALAILGERAGISTTVKLTPRQVKKAKQANLERQLAKDKAARLEAEQMAEYLRLVDIEDWIWRILRTVTGPGDFNRPAVVWALDTRDRVQSLLDDWHRGEMKERLQLMQLTKGVRMWAS